MNATLTQLERDIARISQEIRSLEEVSVRSAAKLLKKSPEFVRSNFPVIIHGAKSHHVRVSDLLAYQQRRTVWPQLNGKKAA